MNGACVTLFSSRSSSQIYTRILHCLFDSFVSNMFPFMIRHKLANLDSCCRRFGEPRRQKRNTRNILRLAFHTYLNYLQLQRDNGIGPGMLSTSRSQILDLRIYCMMMTTAKMRARLYDVIFFWWTRLHNPWLSSRWAPNNDVILNDFARA